MIVYNTVRESMEMYDFIKTQVIIEFTRRWGRAKDNPKLWLEVHDKLQRMTFNDLKEKSKLLKEGTKEDREEFFIWLMGE